MPAVSVIATVLNEATDLSLLLESLRRQTCQPDEIIIVDGGSTDGTWEQLVAAQAYLPALRPIRDETCSRRYSSGPIARGRNVAILAAQHHLIACVDAGCRYDPDWLLNLTVPLGEGTADYVLGGSRLDLATASLWDVAAAPFLGIKLDPAKPTKSCTARSMAFSREAWRRAGTFPETLFIGEDVLFDQKMRKTARTAFVPEAKAVYTPRNGFRRALGQIGGYAIADGVAGMRPIRLLRNVLRCVAMLLAAVLLTSFPQAWWFTLAVLLLETYFAFRLDAREFTRLPELRKRLATILLARWLFSLLVPWIVASHQMLGMLRKQYRTNRQNA